MILGITGNIAAGKSTISDFFRQLGAAVVSADALAREVVRPGGPVLTRLVERFGRTILIADGSLDRQALAALVFADATALADLNRIMHPAIGALAEARLRALDAQVPLVVYEAPMLFEAGAEKRVDAVLVVTISQETQLKRLVDRDGLSEAEAQMRIRSQMPQQEKVARADFVIDNSGARQAAAAAVRAIYAELMKKRGGWPGGK